MRFTIRELVLVTMIAALALGWWMHYRRMKRQSYIHESQANYFRDQLERDGYVITVSPDGTAVGARKGEAPN
jgi:hypothetical protein